MAGASARLRRRRWGAPRAAAVTACAALLLLLARGAPVAHAASLPAAASPPLLPSPDGEPPTDTSAMASITRAAAVRASPTLPRPRPPRPGAAAPPAVTCAGCSDYQRDAYTCAQQREWGCDRSWMAGFCDKTCGRCTCDCPCNDASPKTDATCRQLSDWGFCPLEDEGNAFMAGWCEVTCGRCAAAREGGSALCAPPAPSSGANVCEGRCYNRIADPPPSPSVVDATKKKSSSPSSSDFVTVKDGAFHLAGAPWVFAGTNWYSALYPWWTDENLIEGMAAHAAKGASVIRVFAFTNGNTNDTGYDMTPQPRPIQPTIGVFSEAGLRRLDLVIDAAGRAGLKLILALSNVWDEGGGAQWYVDQVLGFEEEEGEDAKDADGPGPARRRRRPRELFYSDRRVIEAFKAYVRVILTRTNTLNGVPYAADPAIMAWELCNEPQTESYFEAERGLVPGAAMTAWAAEISALIKSLAPRQLTCMGDEGWRVDGAPGKAARRHTGKRHHGAAPVAPFPATGLAPRPPASLPGYEWMNDGAKGVDSVALARMPTLDFQTIHVRFFFSFFFACGLGTAWENAPLCFDAKKRQSTKTKHSKQTGLRPQLGPGPAAVRGPLHALPGRPGRARARGW
jgi:hypothetical protein